MATLAGGHQANIETRWEPARNVLYRTMASVLRRWPLCGRLTRVATTAPRGPMALSGSLNSWPVSIKWPWRGPIRAGTRAVQLRRCPFQSQLGRLWFAHLPFRPPDINRGGLLYKQAASPRTEARSIPAWAGQSCGHVGRRSRRPVYPRVGGAILSIPSINI